MAQPPASAYKGSGISEKLKWLTKDSILNSYKSWKYNLGSQIFILVLISLYNPVLLLSLIVDDISLWNSSILEH